MITQLRFGKRLPVPSTIDVKRDLGVMAATEALLAASSHKERADIIADLACKHGLSRDRAGMLVDRFGIDRVALAGATQDLLERRASFM